MKSEGSKAQECVEDFTFHNPHLDLTKKKSISVLVLLLSSCHQRNQKGKNIALPFKVKMCTVKATNLWVESNLNIFLVF